jgi:ankyrin repeat protein
MNKLLLLLALSVTLFSNAQQMDVFDTARRGTVEEMKALIKANKDTINAISPMGFSPLILACYRGNVPVAEYLATKVKDVNYNSTSGTALTATAVKGDYALSKLLLENKANPNIADPMGITPLIYAVQFENKPLVELLLKYKADTKHANKEGKTILDYALFTKNQEIIKLIETN